MVLTKSSPLRLKREFFDGGDSHDGDNQQNQDDDNNDENEEQEPACEVTDEDPDEDEILCPQILATCKQLCAEGAPVLRENTIGIDIYRYSSEHDFYLNETDWGYAVAGNHVPHSLREGLLLDHGTTRALNNAAHLHFYLHLKGVNEDDMFIGGGGGQGFIYSATHSVCALLLAK